MFHACFFCAVCCQRFACTCMYFVFACKVHRSRWGRMSGSQVSSVSFLVHWRRHLSDTSLHLPTSSISGRLNKVQLIGRWWQTGQAQFIAVWRQPIHFPLRGPGESRCRSICFHPPLCTHLASDVWWQDIETTRKEKWMDWIPCILVGGLGLLLILPPFSDVKGISSRASGLMRVYHNKHNGLLVMFCHAKIKSNIFFRVTNFYTQHVCH